MKKIFLQIVIIVFSISCTRPLDRFSVNSPDGKVDLEISVLDGKLNYQVNWEGQEMLGAAVLEIFPDSNITILSSSVVAHDSIWEPTWGQHSSIQDNYIQLVLAVQSSGVEAQLLARVYNDAVAFRYILQEGDAPHDVMFKCAYTLPEGSQYYAPRGESEPFGPFSISELNEYQSGKVDSKKRKRVSVPLLVEIPNKGYVALLESDLYAANSFQSMYLDVNMSTKQVESRSKGVLESGKLVTPWRVILLGKKAGDLVVSTTTVNLATPCQLEETDWIKPGKTLWDWRVHGYVSPDGFEYGINTESYKRFIDFAALRGVDYFLIDDSWYKHATKGHFELSEKLDLNEVIEYAAIKDVDLMLYYDRKHGEYGDEALFPYYQSLGMKGIKYGFMGSDPKFSRQAIKQSAASELLIDFHDGPVPFTGMRRTYPNAITREYCHAQQDSRRAFTPEAFIKMALINAISGPLDMNNGNFDLVGINSGLRQKGPRKLNSYLSTVASECARTLIIFSGLVCIPDAPEAYEAKLDLFEFIQKMPVGKWDESVILNSEIGECITTARRHGDEWFVGSVINQQGGTLDIDLSFLTADMEYDVTFYEDAEETHCKTNPEAYQIRTEIVSKGDVINAKLAAGGGHCMWIRPRKRE